jgi:hypothetical protein
MALTPTETSLCNKLLGDYAGLISPVRGAQSGIINQRNAMLSSLGGMSYSPPSTLADKINMFKNAVGLGLPNPNDLNSLKNMLTQCDYFKKFGPTAAIAGLMQSALGNISTLINNFSESTPEFGAGKLASLMNQALSSLIPGGSGLSDILKSANDLLNCLSSVCVAGDPSYIGGLDYIDDDLNNLTTSMGLVDNPSSPSFGQMDYGTIYDTVGMTPSQRLAISSVTDTIDGQRVRAKAAIDSSISAVKSQIGGLF